MSQYAGNDDLETALESTDDSGIDLLSVVVIGPDDRRRADVVFALQGPLCAEPQQMSQYPEPSQLTRLVSAAPDVIIVDLDSDSVAALEVVENICVAGLATVMVYSSGSHQDLMIRCMRAGAREFLNLPIQASSMREALVRAAAPAPLPVRREKSMAC
jgi:pilus assembly protein CpaE